MQTLIPAAGGRANGRERGKQGNWLNSSKVSRFDGHRAESLRRTVPELSDPEVIAVDGKTSRRSGNSAEGRAALHLVSAWATAQQLVLGQEAIEDKENEIVAIPRLLGMLELKGALVTIDAMDCQKAIAQTIHDRDADYILPVKDNQPTLRQDIELFFNEQRACNFADAKVFFHQTVEKNHGRLETRRHWSTADIAWLREFHDWTALTSIGMIEREIERNGKTATSYAAGISIVAILDWFKTSR